MASIMQQIAFGLMCLACAGQGRRVHSSSQQSADLASAFNPSSPARRASCATSHSARSLSPRVPLEPKPTTRRHASSSVSMDGRRDALRNIAIVAHVDHGKTTLVDSLLEEDLHKKIGKDERLMDGNDQERERGITILAKNAAIKYKDIKVNIVDTPGHADFGGEVERVLGMVDGVLLVVDAQEGPKPQTRFVLKKALAMGHKVLVVINKVDKPAARCDYVIDKTFDLFCELGASEEQTDFEVVYTSAVNRQSGASPDKMQDNMVVLLDKILDLPKPIASVEDPLQLQISNVGRDTFIGRLGVGRIKSGIANRNTPIGLSAGPGEPVKQVKISELFVYDAMGRASVDYAKAGDIVVFSGIPDFNIGDTLVDLSDPKPLEPIDVEVPTMSITMGVNKSPLAGKSSAKWMTSRDIKDRLAKELETNVALRVEDTGSVDEVQVYGRGLLHLTVLIENMRREGYEVQVGPPKVITKEDKDGQLLEPYELVDIEVPEEFAGTIIDMLSQRKGNMIEMTSPTQEGMQTLQYEMPTRGMVGMKSKVLTASRGLAVMTATFLGYRPHVGPMFERNRGNLVSRQQGEAKSTAIEKCQERGVLFISPNEPVFEGMIIGQNSKADNLPFNICKEKKQTNIRAAGKDENIKLTPPRVITLEDAVEYVIEGEFVEITPDAIRMGVSGFRPN